LDNNNLHIDDLIKDKFESFAPLPPEHIWEEIENGIKLKPNTFYLWNKRTLAIAAIILLASISTSVLIFKPVFWGSQEGVQVVISDESSNETSSFENTESIIDKREPVNDKPSSHTVTNITAEEQSNSITTEEIEIENIEQPDIKHIITGKESELKSQKPEGDVINQDITISENSNNRGAFALNNLKFRNTSFIGFNTNPEAYSPRNRNDFREIPEFIIDEPAKKSNSSWKLSYYLSPELTVSNIDSVEILNSFNLNIEPSWYFNDHWFIRSGMGVSYVRDRGFAKINYITKEYMGSYDDVYDITFDTISGNVVPTYHTKTVEVWDSIRHVSISGITNKYLYMQIPLLLGYYSGNRNSLVNWYVLGGPAINFKISEWIEDPKPAEKDADIIDLENKLPLRANNYYQIWFGAGLEYKVNKKICIGFEPSYRYYLNNIYENTNANGPSSGFSLRVGLVYMMK
jgi:hypothetical protein